MYDWIKLGGMMMDFTELARLRRSEYHIDAQVNIAQEDIVATIEDIIDNSPTAYNAQSFQVVVLFGQKNQNFWQAVYQTQQALLPADQFAQLGHRINTAAKGYGTILLFADNQSTAERMITTPERQLIYKNQDSAILSYALWLALNNIDLGVSLHHFLIGQDQFVHDLFDLPASWEMMAQMPFGRVITPTPKKDRKPGADFLTVITE